MPTGATSILAALLGVASPALAEDCRLALVLALDVSTSVDAEEERLQREGLAQALLAPEVVRAFLADAPVALYAFHWSHAAFQRPILPGWQMVRSEADLASVAATIMYSRRSRAERSHSRTALGAALVHAALALNEAPDCEARTVDIAGDGWNNDGLGPQAVYALPLFDGVTVNALLIGDPLDGQELRAWFQAEVLHGPGAFLIYADGFEDYAEGMEAKLLRELELPLVSGLVLAGNRG